MKELLSSEVSHDEVRLVCSSLLWGVRPKGKPDESLQILGLVGDMDGRLGKNKLAGILTGSRASYIHVNKYDELRHYNLLGNLTQKKVVGLIEKLMEQDYLMKGGNRIYPVVHLTEKGCAALNTGLRDVSVH